MTTTTAAVARLRAPYVAWSMWAVAIALAAVGGGLVLLTLDAAVPDNWGFRGYSAFATPFFATSGLLIARQQPRNAIGWLLLIAGLSGGFGGFVQEYATSAVIVRPGSLPGAVPLAWMASWTFALFAGPLLTLVPQLFPTGRPLSPRWRPLLWAGPGFVLFALVVYGLRPGPLENALFIDNPLALSGALADLRDAIYPPASLLLAGVVLSSGASMVVRFRRARGVERQQLKWMASSAALCALAFAILILTNQPKPTQIVLIAAFVTVPVAIGVAILRYRLYEIDLIIRRTIFYGVLTAAMAGIFAASISVLQRAFVALTGAQSDAAVVLTTLVIVSLFTPVKDQLQRLIDRYFKEPTDAAKRLAPYMADVGAYLEMQRPEQIARRLIEELIRALGATGGSVFVASAGGEAALVESGAAGPHVITLPIGDGALGRVALAARRGGRAYGPEEVEAIRAAVDVAAQAMRLAETHDAR